MAPNYSLKLSITLIFALLGFTACRPMDYYLLHPLQSPPEVIRESVFFDRGQLRVHWVAYYPARTQPLPGVLVHPDAGGLAQDMEGICLSLARAGYFAAAVDYQRLENLEKKNPLFSWKAPRDVTAASNHLKQHPRVDAERVGLLGYSKGGMLSLLIASQDPSLRGVVAYYPLADFEEWLDLNRYSFPKSLWIRGVRAYVLRELRASNWEEALKILRVASPIHQAGHIQAPVLLIHGEEDWTAPLAQVQNLCRKMQEARGRCELFVIPGAGHVFNFRDEEQGKAAWEKTLDFLAAHLKREKTP